MTSYVDRAGLKVADVLARFVEGEVLPGLEFDPAAFWSGAAKVFGGLAPECRRLLETRDRLQARIDAWHDARRGEPFDAAVYAAFLREIGYLVDEPAPFRIDTRDVDDELARLAGPQLVVPGLNARFLLNAANARWGSLYDALYGTDAIPQTGAPMKGYDAVRGAEVVARVKAFLDEAVPLAAGSHADVTGWSVQGGQTIPALADPALFAGYQGDPAAPTSLLFKHNGLHIQLVIDRSSPIGAADPAGVADVQLEAALSTIVDLEDSVAAVDAEDKVEAYSNWLGLMKGDLEATFEKGGGSLRRVLNPDLSFTASDGGSTSLPGRSLLLVRNVGFLMTTSAVLMPDGSELPESLLDGVMTSLIGLYDLRRLDLYRQAEDARPRGGRFQRSPVHRHRGPAGSCAQHPEGRGDGRGAPHLGQPRGLYRGDQEPADVHQHRLPRPHRRRDPHLDARRARRTEGRDALQRLDRGL